MGLDYFRHSKWLLLSLPDQFLGIGMKRTSFRKKQYATQVSAKNRDSFQKLAFNRAIRSIRVDEGDVQGLTLLHLRFADCEPCRLAGASGSGNRGSI